MPLPNAMHNNSTACVATIGFFDGVHLGHRYLINHVRQLAEAQNMASMVVTLCHTCFQRPKRNNFCSKERA